MPLEVSSLAELQNLKWIDFAIGQGFGICNTGKSTGIMYGRIDPSQTPPSWILVIPSQDKDKDRNTLIEAFKYDGGVKCAR